MTRTKVEAELEANEHAHQDDPQRAELLRRARVFKASWIELAEALTEVRRTSRWRDWGFDSFETYTKNELHLRPETADKLCGSFGFLQRRAPEVLRRDGTDRPIPSWQAIDFVRRAEESPKAPSGTADQVFQRVIEDGAPLTKVSREFKDIVFPIDEKARKKRDAAGIKNVATRLRELLEETRIVPRNVATEVQSALDRLLEAVGGKSDAGEEAAA